LIRRQARWAEFVAEFDFIIKYRPGKKNGKPDTLSRRWDHRPEGESEDLQPIQLLFKPGQLQISAIRVVQLKDTFKQELRNTGEASPSWVATIDAVVEGKKEVNKNFSVEDGLLLWKSRWFILEDKDLRTKILQDNHDSQIAGHFGIHKTLERLKHNYHWVRMEEVVTDYVWSCDTCQRDKPSRHKKYGLLEPLKVPYRP